MFRKWMLRTTEPADFHEAIREIVSGERTFLWFHASTPETKKQMEDECRAAGLDILETVPVWFIVACAGETSQRSRRLMALSILEGAQVQCATWRGEMFGYSDEEIAWYTEEVNAAWSRYRKERRA